MMIRKLGKDLRGSGEASGDLPSQTIKMHEEEQILESGGIKEMDVDDTSRRKNIVKRIRSGARRARKPIRRRRMRPWPGLGHLEGKWLMQSMTMKLISTYLM